MKSQALHWHLHSSLDNVDNSGTLAVGDRHECYYVSSADHALYSVEHQLLSIKGFINKGRPCRLGTSNRMTFHKLAVSLLPTGDENTCSGSPGGAVVVD